MRISWLEAHPLMGVALVVLFLFLALNLFAYRHVYAFTHFSAGRRCGPRKDGSFWKRLCRLWRPMPLPRPDLKDRPQDHGLSCEVHTLAGASGRLEGWYLPHPYPSCLVLLFHGYRDCKATLLPEARGLHDLGCACFLVDFPGSGGSEGDRVSIGYHEAREVVRALAYARDHWPGLQVILYGQSMGSAAVLRALAAHSVRAAAAILECPFADLLSAVARRFRNAGVPSFPNAHLFVFWGGIQLGYNGFTHKPAEYAREVTLPVCLLYGSRDRRVSRPEIQSVYDSLAREKEMHIFEDLGHESYVCRQPEKWKRIVGSFLQRHIQAQDQDDRRQLPAPS